MIISDLYYPTIKLNKYNTILGDESVKVTVKLLDFNKKAVTGKSVTLTVNAGYFNKQGNTPLSDTSTKSITATTNSSGQITAYYTANTFGLITFSVNDDAKIQLFVYNTETLQVTNSDGTTSTYTLLTK